MAIITIDQSGKVEKTNEDTIIAAANGRPFIVLLPSKIKREIAQAIKRGALRRYKRYPMLRIFTACVYLSLEKLKAGDSVIIDYEYSGHDDFIRNRLLAHIRERYSQFGGDQIAFVRIGKDSFAHELAIETFRRNRKPNKEITINELLGLL